MFDAWDVTLNGVMIPLLREEWALDKADAAWIGTANLIGMAVGAFLWGTIADRIGRKAAFAWTLAIFSVFTIAGALTDWLSRRTATRRRSPSARPRTRWGAGPAGPRCGRSRARTAG